MPGDITPIRGSQPLEYAEESSYADQLADNTDWNWFGIATAWSVDQGVESESISYLPEHGASDRLEKRVNVKLREMYEGEITYHPQDNFDFLQYYTGTVGDTQDTISSIQIGEKNEDDDEYRRYLGGAGEEITVSVGEDEVVEVNGSFIFGDVTDWTSSDYVGVDGSHATEDSTEPDTYDDLGNVQYGGSDLSGAVESVELTISNDLEVVRDTNSTLPTQIDAIVPVNREITVDLDITYDDFSLLTDVRSYSAKDFTFDIGSTSFTVNDVKFPEQPYEYDAEDLVSDSISSDPATGITWTSP